MDLDKKAFLGIKYYQLNLPEIKKQINRFRILFPRGKEIYMFLFLRTMNIYSDLISHNFLGFLQNQDCKNKVIEYILDQSFIYQVLQYFPMSNQQADEQELADPFVIENDIDSIMDNEFKFPDSKKNSPDEEDSLKLKWFFDYHFQRINDDVFFNYYADFNTENKFVDNIFNKYLNYNDKINAKINEAKIKTNINSNIYANINANIKSNTSTDINSNVYATIDMEAIKPYSGCPYYRTMLDDSFIKFFLSTFSHPLALMYLSDMNIIPLNWSDRKHTILKNYFINFDLRIIFQNKKYQNCLIRFGNDFYKWNCSENNESGLYKLSSSQLYLTMTHEPQGINWFNRLYNSVDAEYCLSVAFPFSNPKSKKPKKKQIKEYLKYFTMNNIKVLDNLALDFVNSILNQNYSHKNTVVTGDYDKFNKWINLFGNIAILQTGLIEILPYITPYKISNLSDLKDDDIKKVIKGNSRNINTYTLHTLVLSCKQQFQTD